MSMIDLITSSPTLSKAFYQRKHFLDLNTKKFNAYYNGRKVVMGEVSRSSQDTLWIRVLDTQQLLKGDCDLVMVDTQEKLNNLTVIPISQPIKKKDMVN